MLVISPPLTAKSPDRVKSVPVVLDTSLQFPSVVTIPPVIAIPPRYWEDPQVAIVFPVVPPILYIPVTFMFPVVPSSVIDTRVFDESLKLIEPVSATSILKVV